MAVNYVEKGIGLWDAIYAAGYSKFGGVDGVYYVNPDNRADTSHDAAVQAIINGYDPLPAYKATAVTGIKATAIQKIQTIFPFLDNIDVVNFVAELWQSLVSAAKSPTANMTKVINVYTTAKTGIANVNAATSNTGVDSAVAAIVWPF
jgi:hypothetical protein